MRFLLDLDGVLVDFTSAAIRARGKDPEPYLAAWPTNEWSIDSVIGITEAEFWAAIDARGTRFWRELELYPWAEELVDFAGEHEWAICTQPSQSHHSAAGKVLWMQDHFGENFRDYYLCAGGKGQLANADSFLIDDDMHNIDAFAAAGGFAMLWPQPWNDSPLDPKSFFNVHNSVTLTC